MKIYNWKQLVACLNVVEDKNQQDISSLVTYARQAGIGKAVSFQKTAYTDIDLDKMNKLVEWWNFLNNNTSAEWRDKVTSNKIEKIVSRAVSEDSFIHIYAVFCPSYNKGKGSYGYAGICGNHTLNMIKKMTIFFNKTFKKGIKIKATAFFSDLLLENYTKLKNTSYKADLEKNFQDFKNKFSKESDGQIEVKKLSSIKDLLDKMGEEGIINGDLGVPKNIYLRTLKRNEIFYKTQLGWSDREIIDRSQTLARCYSFMGTIFRKYFPNSIMYWVESAYERGSMYSGVYQDDPIPIIYPIKDET